MASELSYADYIVIVTGRSNKHMKALASFVRKVYKLKKYKTDILVKIEGKNSKDWIALDLGIFFIMFQIIYYIVRIIKLNYISFIFRKYYIAYFFTFC